MFDTAAASSQALLLSLRSDFATDWAAFANAPAGTRFEAQLTKENFAYVVQGAKKLTIDTLTLYAANGHTVASSTPLAAADLAALSAGLSGSAGAGTLSLPPDNVLTQVSDRQVFLVLQYHFGRA
jgi:hypothetical protein